MTPGPSQPPLPHAFYKSFDLEVIAALHFNNRDGVIHASDLYQNPHIYAYVSSK